MNMKEELKAFVDNEISEADRTRILGELESNPDMQAEVIEIRQVSRVIKEEAWQPPSVGLERTLAALSANRQPKKPWWMGFPQLLAASACAVIMVAVLFPVFAQSKQASMETAVLSRAKQESMPAEMADESVMAGGPGGTVQSPAASAPSRGRAGFDITGEEKSRTLPTDNDSEAGTGKGGDLRASLQPRLQIKTANLSVEVADVPKAQLDAEKIALAVNGRVESSQKSNDEGVLASAELTFRVPVASFETAVNRIRKLGRVTNDSLSGEDVTTQVADTEARLKVMRAEEDQYVELLKATKKIGEVLSVKERLSQVRQEIESLDATRKALRSQAAESTIHLSLTEKPSPDRPVQNPDWSEDAWSRAVSGLSSVGRSLGSAAVFLFVFSPIWLPVVLLGWWLARRARR